MQDYSLPDLTGDEYIFVERIGGTREEDGFTETIEGILLPEEQAEKKERLFRQLEFHNYEDRERIGEKLEDITGPEVEIQRRRDSWTSDLKTGEILPVNDLPEGSYQELPENYLSA